VYLLHEITLTQRIIEKLIAAENMAVLSAFYEKGR
jgi:hypothetical protein